MNKQSVNKLSLFLMGLEQRLADNKDYFLRIDAAYKSGTKIFPAAAILDEGVLKLNFSGATRTLKDNRFAKILASYAENYDSVTVTYQERGTCIIIEADNKNVRMRTKDADPTENIKGHSDTSHIGNRDYYIKVGKADALLKEIGILGDNGKIKNDMIRKYNQIDHFVELISDMIKEMAKEYDTLVVLDCGCGKSYLTFVLNYYIREVLKKPCYFIGLDSSEAVIEASRKMAQNLNYNNMEFQNIDIKEYKADRDIHLVISLHACDTATDQALALAVRNNVKAIVSVPCCHRELLSQYDYEPFKPIIKHGILKARMADVLTDGMRAQFLEGMGYKVSIVEYISPLETPKNLMLRAEKVKDSDKAAMDEYMRLKQLLNVNLTLEKLV